MSEASEVSVTITLSAIDWVAVVTCIEHAIRPIPRGEPLRLRLVGLANAITDATNAVTV